MIKYECNEDATTLEIKGTAGELFADAILFLRTLYKSIEEEDEDTAEFFEYVIRNKIGDLVFKNLDELKEELEEKEKEKSDKIKDLDDMINALDELSEIIKKLKK